MNNIRQVNSHTYITGNKDDYSENPKNNDKLYLIQQFYISSNENRQKEIEPIIRIPKIITGTNTENNIAENPITTDKPLNKMPLPDILNVLAIASSNESPSLKWSLRCHKK